MSEAEAAAAFEMGLLETGVALLRGVFAGNRLVRLQDAATRCFEAIETDGSLAERYRFNRFSHSAPLAALKDFGCEPEELMLPLSAPGLASLFCEALGHAWVCDLEESWVRKKFAPHQAPGREYHLQDWHQDGALGVKFPPEPGPMPPMTELLTCWIPLQACGRESPGLEFVREPQTGLLHFTELEDAALRRRFGAQEFCAPEFEFGDSLVFLNSVLHRTFARPEMRHNRLSVEYRIFPG